MPVTTPKPTCAEEAVGWVVKVYWPSDEEWYRGCVTKSLSRNRVKVCYGTWVCHGHVCGSRVCVCSARWHGTAQCCEYGGGYGCVHRRPSMALGTHVCMNGGGGGAAAAGPAAAHVYYGGTRVHATLSPTPCHWRCCDGAACDRVCDRAPTPHAPCPPPFPHVRRMCVTMSRRTT